MKIDGLGTMSVEEAKAMLETVMDINNRKSDMYELELEMEGIVIRMDAKDFESVMKTLKRVGE